MKQTLALLFAAILLFALPAGYAAAAEVLPSLTYIGHSHLMIITAEGTVIYIDPTKVSGYTYEHNADIILVTHEHRDHNQVDIVPKNDGCVVLRVKDTINEDGTYNILSINELDVLPVPAENINHSIKQTNGLILHFDGIIVYHAADTDKLSTMADLQQYCIDYAFSPSTANTTWTQPRLWNAPRWSGQSTTRPSTGSALILRRSRLTGCC